MYSSARLSYDEENVVTSADFELLVRDLDYTLTLTDLDAPTCLSNNYTRCTTLHREVNILII